jgi:branched-chain amino acid transport system permease protein
MPPGRARLSTALDSAWLRRLALLAVCAFLVAFPLLTKSDYRLFVATQIGIYLLVVVGLNVLTGYAGQPSLGHGALLAIGAYAAAIAMVDHGWSFWPSTLLSMAVTAAAGALMGLPAFRVSTWYFALITLGFAEVVSGMLIEWRGLTHSFNGIVGIPKPAIGGHAMGSAELFWLVAALNVGCFAVVANLVHSRFGRALMAVRDNDAAGSASGVSLVRMKLFAFVLSAAITGLAGALYAVQKTVITPDDFTAEFSIFFLVVVVLGGGGSLWGPALGTLVFFYVPELLDSLRSWRLLIYGVVLLLLMRFAPHGLYGAIRTLWGMLRRRLRAPAHPRPAAPTAAAVTETSAPAPVGPGMAVVVRKAVKRFGGVAALDGVDLDIAAGNVHAIVGPNGSGKTTLLNMISGFYRPDAGSIQLGGVEVVGRSPARIARLYVGRTFQTPKLLPELSASENVMLGGYIAERATGLEVALRLPRARREQRALESRARRYLDFVGLGERDVAEAGDLSHGQQRLAEIARAMIGTPRLLLLDEPAAGLSLAELDRLGALIGSIRALGVTVVIVEHRLELVASICTRVTVLDRGTVLAGGTPAEVFSNPAVVRAYMGARKVGGTPAAGAGLP